MYRGLKYHLSYVLQSIVVRWQPVPIEHQNGKVTGYKIRYKKKGNRKGSTITTDSDKNVYTLTELRKDTSYQVRISALTVNGSGPATDWLYAKTFEDDLDGRFLNITEI